MFKFIDLFAGIGGFHSALSDLGGDCVLACEFDEDCQIVYKSTFPNTKLISNIREITRNDIEDDNSTRNLKEIKSLVPDHDVLCAGFPCQPFSKSGKQKGILDKARGTLFFDIMQIVKAKHPKYLILENVRNLTGPKHSETWKLIIESIREEGYTVSGIPTILSPHLIPKELGGAPQVRDRVFIAATLNGKNEPLYIERESYKHNHNPDNWNIAEYLLPDNTVSQSESLSNYRLTQEELTWLNAWDYLVSKLDSNTLPGFPIWADALTSNPIIEDDMPLWKKNFLIKNSNFYITNKKSLETAHILRSKVNCILTSSTTINEDNPKMNCRIAGLEYASPKIAILDRNLKIKKNSFLIKNAKNNKTFLFYNSIDYKKIKFLNSKKIITIKTPLHKSNLDFNFILKKLFKFEISSILVEGGKQLITSLLNNEFFNEFYLFISSKTLNKRGSIKIKNIKRSLFNKFKYARFNETFLDKDKLIHYY